MTPKRLALGFAVLCAAISVMAIVWAPYLPRLVFERYPQAAWPAPGAFATIAGDEKHAGPIPSQLTGAAFDPVGRRLFEEKDGKALLIFQGGKLRFEHYAEGVRPEARFNSYSMVKSLVGALVLKAHAEGRIRDLEDPIGTYLPRLGDAGFHAIPVGDFLQMKSGIVFGPEGAKMMAGGGKDIEATRLNPFGPMVRLHMLGLDAVAGRLRTRDEERGHFNYQNVNTAILGQLLTAVYGRPLDEVLDEKIWAPAGAGAAYWRRYGPGREVSPYCCLYATPRDWLRIGLFLMNNGTKDRAFLPSPLRRRFMGLDLSYTEIRDGRYGLHIYQNVLDRAGEPLQGPFTYMFGSRGQVTYLMPDRDLVVVRFGQQIQLLHSTLYAAWRSIEQ